MFDDLSERNLVGRPFADATTNGRIAPKRDTMGKHQVESSCDHRGLSLSSQKSFLTGIPGMPQSQGIRFTADPLTFIVRQQLWDANVEDHSDQGVSIEVAADIDGKQTILLRFNCFDIERSYVYGPENRELTTVGRVGGGMGMHCRMDPVTDGNPIGWTIRNLGSKTAKNARTGGIQRNRGDNRPEYGTGRSAHVRGLCQRDLHLKAKHGQTQPWRRNLRSRQYPLRP